MIDTSKGSVTNTQIDITAHGQRLDNYLFSHCKGVPKSHIYRILRSGEVRVNSRRVDAAYRLQTGDLLRLPPLRIAERSIDEISKNHMLKTRLVTVFEDDHLIAINKTAGQAVHGGSGVSFGVIEALRQQRPDAHFLELVHRLDRDTSGLLLVAKKRSALKALHEVLRNGQADKRYLALVSGQFGEKLRHARFPLHKYLDQNGERRVRVDTQGKSAHTVFHMQKSGPDLSLLEANLKTGRTHQIRVHLAHMGFPIVGDEKYGDFAKNHFWAKHGLKRMFLHASSLRCPHPATGETLLFTAALPVELQHFLDTFFIG